MARRKRQPDPAAAAKACDRARYFLRIVDASDDDTLLSMDGSSLATLARVVVAEGGTAAPAGRLALRALEATQGAC